MSAGFGVGGYAVGGYIDALRPRWTRRQRILRAIGTWLIDRAGKPVGHDILSFTPIEFSMADHVDPDEQQRRVRNGWIGIREARDALIDELPDGD